MFQKHPYWDFEFWILLLNIFLKFWPHLRHNFGFGFHKHWPKNPLQSESLWIFCIAYGVEFVLILLTTFSKTPKCHVQLLSFTSTKGNSQCCVIYTTCNKFSVIHPMTRHGWPKTKTNIVASKLHSSICWTPQTLAIEIARFDLTMPRSIRGYSVVVTNYGFPFSSIYNVHKLTYWWWQLSTCWFKFTYKGHVIRMLQIGNWTNDQ